MIRLYQLGILVKDGDERLSATDFIGLKDFVALEFTRPPCLHRYDLYGPKRSRRLTLSLRNAVLLWTISVGFVTHKEQSSCSCSFGTAALTLWRMAWEGVMHPVMLELHSHPAFGIAVWLSQHPRAHRNFEVASKILLCEFQSALEASLGYAIVLAHVMHSCGTYLLEPRLLPPSIFDCTRIQRLTKRTLVSR